MAPGQHRTQHASGQRGPTSAHHTHKQKRALLQEARRRRREEDRPDDPYEAGLLQAAARVPKVVQARLYTWRACRGGEVRVRVRLAIDRQLCAGYVPGSSSGDVAAAAADVTDDEPPPPESDAQRRGKRLRARTTALSARLSATAKLKSLRDVEREWLDCLHVCSQFVVDVASDADAALRLEARPLVFGLVQQAVQTGPLSFAKPAQFKRFAKACAGDGRTSGEHPHIKAVRRVLEAVAPLLASAPGATVVQPNEADSDASAAAASGDDAAADLAEGGGGGEDGGAGAGAGGGDGGGQVAFFSEKQTAVLHEWIAEFSRWCATTAPARRE